MPQVLILEITAGSALVTFAITPAPGEPRLPAEVEDRLFAKVTAAQACAAVEDAGNPTDGMDCGLDLGPLVPPFRVESVTWAR